MESPDGVGFRYPALLALFAAKWMFEDSRFAEELLRSPIMYAPVIEHASALRRNDRDLLASILRDVDRLVSDLGDEVAIDMFDRSVGHRGWSDAPDIERLRHDIESEAEDFGVDELDELFERIEEAREDDGLMVRQEVVDSLNPLGRYHATLMLLSMVLRNSELLDDLAIKEDALRQAIHGWGLVTVIVAVKEDQTGILRQLIAGSLPEDASADDLDRSVDMAVTFTGVLGAVGGLSVHHLSSALSDLVSEHEFMSSSARALLATLLYCALDLDDWPDHLRELYETYGGHPVIASLCRGLALSAYRSPSTRRSLIPRLEKFLVEIYSPSAPIDVRKGPLHRAAVTDRIRRDLRADREKHRSVQEAATAVAIDVLAGDTFVDVDEPGEGGGGGAK
jgi:hypothetical protein